MANSKKTRSENERRVQVRYFPTTYDGVRHLLRVWCGHPEKQITRLRSILYGMRGTHRDRTDWKDPDTWIPERLSGDLRKYRKLAESMWIESNRTVNPRHTQGHWFLMDKYKLVKEDDNGKLALTDRGQDFLKNHSGKAVAFLDEQEGLIMLLTLIKENGPAPTSELIKEWAEYLIQYSAYRTTSSFIHAIQRRLKNLLDRGLINRTGTKYSITDSGRAYLQRTRAEEASSIDDQQIREELDASVKAYIDMRTLEQHGKELTKKKYYDDLSTRFGRSFEAFEDWMQNISYVYSQLGRRWIKEIEPEKSVDTDTLSIIEELIHENEDASSNLREIKEFIRGNKTGSVYLEVEFEERVSKRRQKEFVSEPSGNQSPTKQIKISTSYNRDDEVTAWLLEKANGICEKCRRQAPFVRYSDNTYYLEVHHLKRLADGGSDTVANAVAVCPNCHRELHFGVKREELLNALYRKVKRLKRE